MKFTPTWYKNPNLSDVPSFQELEDITGMAYDNEGYYIGPKEKPKMQLVMDQRTNRQYWAPEEYDEDAVKYGAALLDREFNSKEWWGMMNDPLLSMGEKVSVASVELLKQTGKTVAKAPTEIVAGVTGMTDAVGIDAGNLAKSVWANLNPVVYFGSQVARKGIKATAQDYVDLLKNIKTPKGEMGETAALYRASAKNWEATIDKWLPDVEDNIKAHSTLVTVGSMAGQIGGSLLLAAATSYVGGLPAVAGVFGSQQFYNLREEYLSKGYSLQSANIYAGVGAILEGGLEALGFSQWLKYATLKPSLRNHLIAGLMESNQEMLQTGAEAALTNFSGVREETLVEVLAQIAIAGVAGFIPGAGISLVSGGIGIRTEKAKYELDKAIEQAPKPVQPTTKEGQYIKGPNAKQELELAKANKGSNPVYEFVRNLAVANGIKGEEQIDALFYFARNQQAQGIVGEELLQGLGKQIVAFHKQLALPDKTADKENKKAAEDITYHLSEEAVKNFHDDKVKAMQDIGISKEQAEISATQMDMIYQNLSKELGMDLQELKPVKVTTVPVKKKTETKQEQNESIDTYDGEIPFQDRQQTADEEISNLQKYIEQVDKMANVTPKTTLLSTLRKTGVDYSNTRLDPQVLKDMRIKNVPVSKGGLGGESLQYLVRHGFATEASMEESYAEVRDRETAAEDLLERAISGEDIYRLDDQEKLDKAYEAGRIKEKLQEELDALLAEKGKRGYIKLGKTINEIVLGQTSDITTLQHELMHHWQDVIEIAAAKGNKKAQALQKQIDKIIAENKDYVKQDLNKSAEVLTEAYERWLYTGVVTDSEQQELFNSIKKFFRQVYDGVRAITGIRMNGEIDYLFRQMTGLAPIDMRGEGEVNATEKGGVMFQTGMESLPDMVDIDGVMRHTKNSEGRQIAHTLDGIKNFYKWFKDSKVVDEEGRPLVVYHGTNEDFNAFDKTKIGKNASKLGGGFYTTNIEKEASGYGKTMPLYLSIKNPLRITNYSENITMEQRKKLYNYLEPYKWVKQFRNRMNADDQAFLHDLYFDLDDEVRYDKFREALNNVLGIDGIINSIKGTKGTNEFIVFEPTQIKSVDNQGTFDPQKENIYLQTIKAQQTGAKAADEKPSKEQIATDLEIIKRNGVEKYEKKSGFWSQIGETAQGLILSVRQRAGAIDPKLKAFFDKLDYFQPALEKKFADQTKGWFKKYHDLTEEDKNIFDYYIYNQLHEELDIFLKEKNMTKEYQQVRNLLNYIYSMSNQVGIDMGFISEYFPTSMIDHEGFMNHMKGTEKWTYIEKSLKEADPQGLWDSKQRAEAVNKLLRGYKLTDPVSKPKNAKERTILYKSPELMKFYEHSDKALMKYLQGMSRAIAINKAFGKGKGFNTDETIGAIVLELIESGTITRKEEDTVRHLLKSRLSYSATPQFIGLIKNVGYLSMMNNITSAITQLGDLYAPFYKYSFPTAIEAIFGKKELDRSDLGLDKIWEEFSDKSKTGIAVDKLFKAIGLDKMDQLGKKVAMQASLLNLRKQAEKGDVELLNRLSYTFGKDSSKVLADIKSGKVTEDVKILVFSDLADTQPIGKSGVPTGYLNHPTMRLFYQLKTFMLNQMSLFYADSMVNIQKGIKHKNKAQFLKGVQNGFKLVLLLTAGNAGADVLKNLIMGREIDISDTIVSNLLWNLGVSKYTFYKGQREGYAWALFSNYFMPPQIGTADDVQRDARRMAQGKQELKDSMLWTFVPFGRMYYWWFGGASEEGKERKKKLTKKVNARNRRKNKNKRREK